MTASRLIWRIALVLLAVGVLYCLYITYSVWHGSTLDERGKADAIVVLGAAQYNGVPSPVLRARLDHAADLWKQQYAPLVVVTGGRAPGDNSTEAGASAAYLATKGVPDEVVLREVQGRSSWESLRATHRFLEPRNVKRVLLVSDSFHNARIAQMARDLGWKPMVSPTSTSPITGDERSPYFLREMASLGLGRVIGFGRVERLEKNVTS